MGQETKAHSENSMKTTHITSCWPAFPRGPPFQRHWADVQSVQRRLAVFSYSSKPDPRSLSLFPPAFICCFQHENPSNRTVKGTERHAGLARGFSPGFLFDPFVIWQRKQEENRRTRVITVSEGKGSERGLVPYMVAWPGGLDLHDNSFPFQANYQEFDFIFSRFYPRKWLLSDVAPFICIKQFTTYSILDPLEISLKVSQYYLPILFSFLERNQRPVKSLKW